MLAVNVVSSIEWDMLDPGSVMNKELYVKNLGNVPITLYLETENWNPANASDYISLSWDYSGEAIDPDVCVHVTLTLSVSSDIEGIADYSFDMVITGTG